MSETTLKIGDRFLKPGTRVLVGPPNNRFEGVIYKTGLTVYCDQSNFIDYYVEWWDDKNLHRDSFQGSDVEVVEDTV